MARLPKSIIKKYGITKKAWAVFRGRKGKRKSAKPKTNPKKVRRMGKRKKKGGGGKSMTRTAFKLIRLGALVGGGLAETVHYDKPLDKVAGGLLAYGGFSHKNKAFYADLFVRTWTPYVMACLATYGIPKLVNIIRRL